MNVAGKAGDLLIWHRMTPHGSSRNMAADCRLALFFNLYPAAVSESDRQDHMIKWQTQWGSSNVNTSALGRRLAGMDAWNG